MIPSAKNAISFNKLLGGRVENPSEIVEQKLKSQEFEKAEIDQGENFQCKIVELGFFLDGKNPDWF